MHPGQITALTAALAATMVTLVAYMSLMSGDPSKTFIRSTWHLTVKDSESGEGTPQTWYINTADNVIKIVEQDEESGSINVQEIHAGGVYDYSRIDPDLDLTVPVEECDDVDFTDYDGDCESYRALIQSGIDELSTLEIKDQCSETLLTDETITFAETLPCDGNAEVGGFTVSFAECTPTAILDKESGNIVATIDSIEDGIDESVTFNKCQDDTDDEDAARRKLFNKMKLLERLATRSDWCGGETEFYGPGKAVCPGDQNMRGIFKDNQACRLHDHAIVGHPQEFLRFQTPLIKLECQVDLDLVNNSNNWLVHAVFAGKWLGGFQGCLNYQNRRFARWRFTWSRGWYRQKTGWQWVTRHGRNRLKEGHGMNNRKTMGHTIPTATIPHPRGINDKEINTQHATGKQWYWADIPRDKIYKRTLEACPKDGQGDHNIANDINWW